MFQQLKRNFSPSGVDFEALRSAGQFSHKVQRLRDLKSEAEPLPPPLQSQEQGLSLLETLEVLSPPLAQEELKKGPAALLPSQSPPESATNHPSKQREEKAVLARRMREEKAKIRLEKLKDLQHHLNQLCADLETGPAPQGPALGRLQKGLLAIQKQLATPYSGPGTLPENEGMGVVRPYLVKLTQKLDCLQQNKPEWLEKVRQAEKKVIEKLKAPNPLPVLERAALLALGEALERALGLFFAQAEPAGNSPTLSVESVAQVLPEILSVHQLQTRLFQARAQLRNLRSEAEKFPLQTQIQAWEKELAQQEIQEHIQYFQRFNRSQEQASQQIQRIAKQVQTPGVTSAALRLAQNSLLQIGLKLLKEWQGIQDMVTKWGAGYRELLPLLQHTQRHWGELRDPAFFLRWQSGAIVYTLAETGFAERSENEQAAINLCLTADQSLFQQTTQNLADIYQGQADLELQAKITQLDSLWENWQVSLSSASEALEKAEDEHGLCQAVGSLERATGQYLRKLPAL